MLPGEESVTLDVTADALGEALGLDLLEAATALRATGKAGEVATTVGVVGKAPVTVLLVGVGDQSTDAYRRAGAALARACRGLDSLATSVPAGGPDRAVQEFVVGAMLGSFGFRLGEQDPRQRPVTRVVLTDIEEDRADATASELERALALGGAGWLARSLAWVPSNLKNPAFMADEAQRVAETAGLTCTVWDEQKLAEQKMGGILGVGQASATPPCLIRLDYTPAGARRGTPHIVLVGKGITFDSGGLSIKPAESMATMKRDMTGGAVVIAVLGALAALGCRVRVTGLVPAAENAIGGNALRPGDVITHYGGRTSEVRNTDAEGRLVLADALAFAADTIKPDLLVDVATLTGAMKVALGQTTGGFFATTDALADDMRAASVRAGEPLWRMPLVEDYEDKLSSKVADGDNAPGGAGAITAALFLRHFTGGLPWVHLDIASAGDSPTERFEWSQGPTGFSARALLEFLTAYDA